MLNLRQRGLRQRRGSLSDYREFDPRITDIRNKNGFVLRIDRMRLNWIHHLLSFPIS